jgi:hypothetical protein
MSKIHSLKYKVCRCDGEVITIHCPEVFGPYDVAKRLVHDLVFYFVPKGRGVYVDHPLLSDSLVQGPAWIFVTADEETYQAPSEPMTDHDCGAFWATYVCKQGQAA